MSKSTPSWMNEPIDATVEDGNARDLHMQDEQVDDMNNVPLVLTVPSLVDEVRSRV